MIEPATPGQERQPFNEAASLNIGGLAPLSTLDYADPDTPGALAAVLFCQGCPWRCPYCHNAALQPNHQPTNPTHAAGLASGAGAVGTLSWAECLAWLGSRRGILDAVVFSGGEPTRQPALRQAMAEVRALGFRLGLHTAGMFPEALAALLPRCNWVGLDIKAPRALYDRITGRPGSAEPAFASLELLQRSGVAFEVRTTWHPALLDEAALLALAGELGAFGPLRWSLQAFRPQGCADAELAAAGPVMFAEDLLAQLRNTAPSLTITLRE
ncbi:anaerobic ribonucleoside-triphosphate reductase activating protein [Megalodesulfovibrio paquesii]